MWYWIKTHAFIKWLFPKFIWNMPKGSKTVYLTFDDGPIPEITPWVLAQLEKYRAKATFFCIGDNVQKHPEIFQQVVGAGHAIGNHTFNHLNGWETTDEIYLENVRKCSNAIRPEEAIKLFRPPYGKIKRSQSKAIRKLGYKIIMWDILSGDFDQTLAREKCLQNVLDNICEGSIIIFHDSEKAFGNLEFVLPKTLQFLYEKGYECAEIKVAPEPAR